MAFERKDKLFLTFSIKDKPNCFTGFTLTPSIFNRRLIKKTDENKIKK
jgi:hypothetical protein